MTWPKQDKVSAWVMNSSWLLSPFSPFLVSRSLSGELLLIASISYISTTPRRSFLMSTHWQHVWRSSLSQFTIRCKPCLKYLLLCCAWRMRLQSRLKTLTTQMQKKNNLLTLLRLQEVCMWIFFSPVSLADRIIWKMVRMASILCAVVSRGQKAYFSLTLKYSDISVSQNIRLLLGQWWILSPDKGSERKALVIQPMIRLLVGFSCFAPFFLSK